MELPLNSLCYKILLKSKKLSDGFSSSSVSHSKSDGSLAASLQPRPTRLDATSSLNVYDEVASWGEVSDENSADELNDLYKVQPILRRNDSNEVVENLKPYDQRR